MAVELSFCLINPYTIGKSRTGGVIGRIMTRTGLELVASRMFGPSAELVEQYASLIRSNAEVPEEERGILADYVLKAYSPDAKTGKRRRVLLLAFEGEDAVAKVRDAVGALRPHAYSGETVRDTYGDFIVDATGKVTYVEPAVMTAGSEESVAATLKLWTSYAETDGGIVAQAYDVSKENDVQQTLVIIKPDNFTFPSSRPGNIIDIFSRSGLRIVAAKVNRMTVAQAEEFYGPVRDVLRQKMKSVMAKRGGDALEKEMGFEVPPSVRDVVGEHLGPLFGDIQFNQIIEFMTGVSPIGLTNEQKVEPGRHRSLVLIYSGVNAVEKIRKILGPTDPSKAEPGSVRKEFGRDIMVNAAHASDSPENAQREMRIVKPEEDWTRRYYEKYYA
ncbi:MAG: nucleoside-diphosphate kinase [Kiritimatiellae bacterium]|nr:nucleoside-diphosphate kinase [Kiritimatiellia bacterium]